MKCYSRFVLYFSVCFCILFLAMSYSFIVSTWPRVYVFTFHTQLCQRESDADADADAEEDYWSLPEWMISPAQDCCLISPSVRPYPTVPVISSTAQINQYITAWPLNVAFILFPLQQFKIHLRPHFFKNDICGIPKQTIETKREKKKSEACRSKIYRLNYFYGSCSVEGSVEGWRS